ncbi:fumarylacetoacetate hydrolase family protein [Nocardia sp. R6R-6]|uniref:fumarylacetoacetate hydrolase family protein n=1 Tax=Nocardia sp. R6R-6 TaxID=3459303 RepID=UPI00403DEC9C
MQNIADAAQQIWAAERQCVTTPQLTAAWPAMDAETAYRIQDAVLEQRLAAGHRMVGIKLGLTSVAKQVSIGIDSPTVAWLTDDMALSLDKPIDIGRFIHPRAEPEIAFVTNRDLAGPGMTASEALSAVGSVHAAVEIIDSRYRDFKFRIEDTIADNSSSGGFLLATPGVDPAGLDLRDEQVVLENNGEVVGTASGADVYGHPAEALAWAVNRLALRQLNVPAGSIVLTGGMTEAIRLSAGDSVTARFATIGTIGLTVMNDRPK